MKEQGLVAKETLEDSACACKDPRSGTCRRNAALAEAIASGQAKWSLRPLACCENGALNELRALTAIRQPYWEWLPRQRSQRWWTCASLPFLTSVRLSMARSAV
jgi:hypothetical protein